MLLLNIISCTSTELFSSGDELCEVIYEKCNSSCDKQNEIFKVAGWTERSLWSKKAGLHLTIPKLIFFKQHESKILNRGKSSTVWNKISNVGFICPLLDQLSHMISEQWKTQVKREKKKTYQNWLWGVGSKGESF